MLRRRVLSAAIAVPVLTGLGGAAAAHAGPPADSAYDIKALTPQQIDDLLNGRGAGRARAAELNSYPGPMHVLELDAELRLTAEQRRAAQRLMEWMRPQAVRLGRQILDVERELDRAFRTGAAREGDVHRLTARAAELEGRLRAVHLETHRRMRAVLTAEQIERYNQLRGYV
jgi:hypothetical protein